MAAMGGIVEVVIGGILSIGTAIVIESLRRPSLRLEGAEPIEFKGAPGAPDAVVRSLRVKLTNRPLVLMQREPAVQCRAAISFHYLDRQDIFGRSMEGRWTDTPEPVLTIVRDADGKPIAGVVPELRQTVNVAPGEGELLDIAIRIDDEPDCYGWSNQSYLSTPPWRDPNWQLKPRSFLVKVADYLLRAEAREVVSS
jgi:hypothetical protein